MIGSSDFCHIPGFHIGGCAGGGGGGVSLCWCIVDGWRLCQPEKALLTALGLDDQRQRACKHARVTGGFTMLCYGSCVTGVVFRKLCYGSCYGSCVTGVVLRELCYGVLRYGMLCYGSGRKGRRVFRFMCSAHLFCILTVIRAPTAYTSLAVCLISRCPCRLSTSPPHFILAAVS